MIPGAGELFVSRSGHVYLNSLITVFVSPCVEWPSWMMGWAQDAVWLSKDITHPDCAADNFLAQCLYYRHLYTTYFARFVYLSIIYMLLSLHSGRLRLQSSAKDSAKE